MVLDEENLLRAARNAARGKRFRDNVLRFNERLGENLLKLKRELERRTYRPGSYRTFEIFEPKKRTISAAPFRDRVVHHALCNVIAPIFEATFIRDSYANRKDYGTHRALRRCVKFARESRYVLKCDVEKYFPSIDHAILKGLISRKIKCPDTLWLVDTVIDHSNEQEPRDIYFEGDDLFTPFERKRGLPIGNLTSQFFANIYLNGLDHFVKERLSVKGYVRYVDDFVLFGDDRDELSGARLEIEHLLRQLRLLIHPIKSQLFETKLGVDFVGYRILGDRVRVRNANLRRSRKRLRSLAARYSRGEVSVAEVTQRIRSWLAHLQHADTRRLTMDIFQNLRFVRNCDRALSG